MYSLETQHITGRNYHHRTDGYNTPPNAQSFAMQSNGGNSQIEARKMRQKPIVVTRKVQEQEQEQQQHEEAQMQESQRIHATFDRQNATDMINDTSGVSQQSHELHERQYVQMEQHQQAPQPRIKPPLRHKSNYQFISNNSNSSNNNSNNNFAGASNINSNNNNNINNGINSTSMNNNINNIHSMNNTNHNNVDSSVPSQTPTDRETQLSNLSLDRAHSAPEHSNIGDTKDKLNSRVLTRSVHSLSSQSPANERSISHSNKSLPLQQQAQGQAQGQGIAQEPQQKEKKASNQKASKTPVPNVKNNIIAPTVEHQPKKVLFQLLFLIMFALFLFYHSFVCLLETAKSAQRKFNFKFKMQLEWNNKYKCKD